MLRRDDGYVVAECKYLKSPMTLEMGEEEEAKILAIDELDVKGIIFVSANGFSFSSDRWKLITGDNFYRLRMTDEA